jgi:CRP/FNR family cyclic AMP-dependent transcriptional regulator
VGLFRRFVSSRPEIAIEVTRQLSERMKRVEARVENLVFGDVRTRLAAVLVELAADLGGPERAGQNPGLGLSQGELATLIGSTRQSVNAAMSELKDQGMVRLLGGRTELLDLDGLRRIGQSKSR